MASNKLAAELLDQVMSLSGRVAGIMRDGLEALDLTETLANLIWLVDPAVDPVPLRKLAARLHYDPSNVTLLCSRLEEKGLAERRPHPRDGRVRTLVLTKKGVQVRNRLLRQVTARSPLGVLDAAEQRQLQVTLTKVLGTI
ncbi:MarR family winged helix-turn-helix transcriptional regulator [Amycolatopsis ultiminotia]